ncbi:hypothetical protein R3P38DRAFT_3478077 [Favolaschia claudopus]|uniref:Uncharacterized protein n=1 Tax=Favolaschia claudopus TaxID=2862362 RepID=A0AAV9ZA18_9AGAR
MFTLNFANVVKDDTKDSLASPTDVDTGRFNPNQVSTDGTGVQWLETDLQELRAALQALCAQDLNLTPEAREFMTTELIPLLRNSVQLRDCPTAPGTQKGAMIGHCLKRIQKMLLYCKNCAKSAARALGSGPPLKTEPKTFVFRERTTSVNRVEVVSETTRFRRSYPIQNLEIGSINGGAGGSGGPGSGTGGNGGMGTGPRFEVAHVQTLNLNWHIYLTNEETQNLPLELVSPIKPVISALRYTVRSPSRKERSPAPRREHPERVPILPEDFLHRVLTGGLAQASGSVCGDVRGLK